MAHPLFELGQQCDSLLQSDQLVEAESGYKKLLQEIERGDYKDQYLLSKTCLGLMMCFIRQRRTLEAHAIFRLTLDDIGTGQWLALGLYGLDRQRVSTRDYLVYGIVCACLYTASDASVAERAADVRRIMTGVCEASLSKFPDIFEAGINQWKILLVMAIFKGADVPDEHVQAIRRFEEQYDKPVPLTFSSFPSLDVWERPFDSITLFDHGEMHEVPCDRTSLPPEGASQPPASLTKKPWWRVW
jgi:hypothetical protein